MTPLAWNIRDLHCYSVCLAAPENTHLVRNLVRLVFGFLSPEKAKAAKWRLVSALFGGADGARTRDLRRDRPAF